MSQNMLSDNISSFHNCSLDNNSSDSLWLDYLDLSWNSLIGNLPQSWIHFFDLGTLKARAFCCKCYPCTITTFTKTCCKELRAFLIGSGKLVLPWNSRENLDMAHTICLQKWQPGIWQQSMSSI